MQCCGRHTVELNHYITQPVSRRGGGGGGGGVRGCGVCNDIQLVGWDGGERRREKLFLKGRETLSQGTA